MSTLDAASLLVKREPYAFEQLRQRFLYVVSSDIDQEDAAQIILQLAYDGEMRAVMLQISPEVASTAIATRRKYLDIDNDMQSFKFMVRPVLKELMDNALVGESYYRLFDRYLTSPSPRFRMTAVAAMLCLGAAYLPARST